MWNPIRLLTPVVLVLVVNQARAAEISIRADRERIRQGEHALVTITVRKCTHRPAVTPPSVPYCQIELAGERQLRSTSPQRGTTKGGAPDANQRLGKALSDLDERLQNMPGELARRQGADPTLFGEYENMLRDIRRQAIQALNNGVGPADHEIQFRVTPQRSGELNLPPFLVKVGPQAVQTQGLKLIIEPGRTAAPSDASAAGSASPGEPAAAEEGRATAVAARGFAFEPWHWVIVLLAGPLVGAIAYLLVGRRREGSPRAATPVIPAPVAVSIQEGVASARSTDEVVRFVTELVRVRCRLPAGEVTPAEACAALQKSGVSPQLAERFATLLDDCAAARFAPEPVTVFSGEIVHSARMLVAELEGETLRV